MIVMSYPHIGRMGLDFQKFLRLTISLVAFRSTRARKIDYRSRLTNDR
jgi:hypothetical protein